MVIMIVRDDDDIDEWNISNCTWHISISFRSQPGDWRTSRSENGVEQYSKATWKLDVETCMAQPSCSKAWSMSSGEERRSLNRYRWWCCVRYIRLTGNMAPSAKLIISD